MRLKRCRWWVAASGLVVVACGSPSRHESADVAGAANTKAATESPSGNDDAKVNLEEIFPAGVGRDLVLDNCQSCHTFVPIVVLQMDKDAWQRWAGEHRDRV